VFKSVAFEKKLKVLCLKVLLLKRSEKCCFYKSKSNTIEKVICIVFAKVKVLYFKKVKCIEFKKSLNYCLTFFDKECRIKLHCSRATKNYVILNNKT